MVARHITSHKQAEAALRLSEERLRAALKDAPVVVFTQDLVLRYTWITPPGTTGTFSAVLTPRASGLGTSVALSAALPPKSSARNRPRA